MATPRTLTKEHQPLNVPLPHVNSQTFNVAFDGNWSVNTLDIPLFRKNVTWNWALSGEGLESGVGTSENYDNASKTAVDGNLHLWKNVFGYAEQWTSGTTDPDSTPVLKAPQTAVLKYFARDNADGAEAEARYALTLHEPIEIVSHRQLVFKFNVEAPAYVPDSNGVWNLLTTLQTNQGQTFHAGTQTVGVSRSSAHAKGFSYGFNSGIELGFATTLGYTHTEESTWSKDISVSANLPEDISNGQSAYIVVLFPFQRLKTTYRRYDSSGEIRRNGSPAYPAPSILYALVFDESTAVNPPITWKIVDADVAVPGPKTEEPVFSAPEITES